MENLREKIEKMIEMNGLYSVSFPLPENTDERVRGGHGHIEIRKKNEEYIIDAFNKKDGKFYLNLQDYSYIIYRNKYNEYELYNEIDCWCNGFEEEENKKIFWGNLPLGWEYGTAIYNHFIEVIEALGITAGAD